MINQALLIKMTRCNGSIAPLLGFCKKPNKRTLPIFSMLTKWVDGFKQYKMTPLLNGFYLNFFRRYLWPLGEGGNRKMSTLEGKKKKIGEPLERCLPPHLPLLWILICVQEMGINCWSIMELPLPIKCHSRSWSGRLRVCLTKNKREKCENYFGTWTVLLH